MKAPQTFYLNPVDPPLWHYCQKLSVNGKLCDTDFLKRTKIRERLFLIINRLEPSMKVIKKRIDFHYCRNSTQIPELCDRTVALHSYTGCYATPVVH